MTSSSLKLWRTLFAYALLWVTATVAQEDVYQNARHCYDCVYQVSTDSWLPCKGPIAEKGLSSQVVDAPHCFTNCFTKINQNGDIRRGCYDGTYGIDQNLLGCNIQGSDNALYCFCKDDRCNNSPHKSHPANTTKAIEPKRYNYDSQPSHIEDPMYHPTPSTEVHDIYEPAYTPQHHGNNQDYSPHPHDYNHDPNPQDYDYEPSNYNQEAYEKPYEPYVSKTHYDQRPDVNDHRPDHEHYTRSKGKHQEGQNRDSEMVEKKDARSYNHDKVDVVYGVKENPVIYTAPAGYPARIEHINKKRDWETADLNNYEHNVDVSTGKQIRHDGTDIHGSRDGDDFKHSEHGGTDITNEYVDHTHRQRQLQATHSIGKDLQEIANIHPGSSVIEKPHIEHKQTQHFHKYDIGERTIEHHIVEHYVLHHRIKELLRNRHGLDVHNVDPRQVSLIYRLLHPHKAAEWDKEKAVREKFHITE